MRFSGTVAGGLFQFRTAKAQLAAAQTQRENDYRRQAYEDYLRVLLGTPQAIEDGMRSLGEDHATIVRDVGVAVRDADARLLLAAPAKIRAGIEHLGDVWSTWTEESNQQSGKANMPLPFDERESIVAILTRTFNAVMRPAIRQLTSDMQESLT